MSDFIYSRLQYFTIIKHQIISNIGSYTHFLSLFSSDVSINFCVSEYSKVRSLLNYYAVVLREDVKARWIWRLYDVWRDSWQVWMLQVLLFCLLEYLADHAEFLRIFEVQGHLVNWFKRINCLLVQELSQLIQNHHIPWWGITFYHSITNKENCSKWNKRWFLVENHRSFE